ncbi:MAG: HEPN domain-containing protein [Nitrososphaerales archaeon]
MSIDEAEVLRERAYSFLRNAKRLFEEKEYDLAAFNLEQFCQLLLKYKLLIRTGTYPRTHSLIRILRELDAAYPEKNLASFIDSEILLLTKMEDVYIISRYIPRRYEKKEVEQLIAFAEKFKDVVEDV